MAAMWAVEIHGLHRSDAPVLDLRDILEALGATPSKLDWLVLDFDPVTDDPRTEAIADEVYEQRPTGVRLTFAELSELAAKTRQTIDGQFVGVLPSSSPAIAEAQIVLKAIDSSFWIVIAKSPDDVAAIRSHFRDVRDSDRALELGQSFRDV
jgi:hypothetical protein